MVCCYGLFAASPKKILIGVAGGTGAGKSTLAQKIHEAFPSNSVLLSQDFYYKPLTHLPVEERAKTNFDHPDSLDFSLMRQQLLALKNNQPIERPVYNFRCHQREEETRTVEPADIIIVEGILLFAVPEIANLFDLKFFIDADEDVRLLRRIGRDLNERARSFESVQAQYLKTVKPMHELFVEPSKKEADMIVPHGGENLVALDLIVSRLSDLLKK